MDTEKKIIELKKVIANDGKNTCVFLCPGVCNVNNPACNYGSLKIKKMELLTKNLKRLNEVKELTHGDTI